MLNLKSVSRGMSGRAVVALAGGLLLLAGGCQMVQRVENAPPEPASDAPLVVDAAMQLRDWPRSTALYASGDTIAGPTGFPYEARWYQSEWRYPLIEPALFVGQTLMLPVTYVQTPPWSEVRYTGVTIDPTYTAMPALPPSPGVLTPVETPPEPTLPASGAGGSAPAP